MKLSPSLTAALLGGAILFSPALAQEQQPPPANPPSPTNPAADAKQAQIAVELPQLFKDYCLDRYPDEAAVKALAEERHATPLSQAEISTYLKADPGFGWRFSTPLGLYVLTIERPPVRACGLRRMTPAGLASAQSWIEILNAFGKEKGFNVGKAQQQHVNMGGIDLTAFPQMLTKPGQSPQMVMLILSNYHSRPPAEFAEDARGGVGVETRLVRQLGD